MESRLALKVLVLLALPAASLGLRNVTSADPSREHHRAEVARLRAHFDSVGAELRAATALPLTPAQRQSRATLIGWLRYYGEAGSFPRNDRFPDRAMPFFRDSRGVLCAMAYLIDRSGRGDLVDRIAATRNNAFIAELAGNPELSAWLDSTGLSLAEAARIQPYYGFPPGETQEPGVSASYAITSILVGGSSLATVGVNAITPSRTSGWAGVLIGAAGLITGAVKLDEDGATDDVAAVNMIAGGGALAFGAYRLLAPRPIRPRDEQPAPTSPGVAGNLSISPVLMPAARDPRLGLAVHATF